MKKKYLSPEVVELVEVMEELMVVTSPEGFKGEVSENPIEAEDMLSRPTGVWDDGE